MHNATHLDIQSGRGFPHFHIANNNNIKLQKHKLQAKGPVPLAVHAFFVKDLISPRL